MFKRFLLGTSGLLVAAGMASTAANALMIDDFTDGPQAIQIIGPLADADPDVNVTLLDNAGGLMPTDAGPHASILGGYRDISTTLIHSPNSFSGTTALGAVSPGIFSHSQDNGVASHSYITWNGLEGGGLNADLTDGGSSYRFHLLVLTADDGVDWSLEVADGDSSFLYGFENNADINAPTSLYLPFALFAGIDFTDILSIRFGANVLNTDNFDTSVGLLETVGDVPEPASMALIGAGLFGLGGITRRRKVA
ncbi:MAG: PEP-CTERM sorting domain-containing protein [Alphaproteobacteria bacterium]